MRFAPFGQTARPHNLADMDQRFIDMDPRELLHDDASDDDEDAGNMLPPHQQQGAAQQQQQPPVQAPHQHHQIHTRHIPLYQRLVHALCLTLVPFLISRILMWALVKYNVFFAALGVLDWPGLSYVKHNLLIDPSVVGGGNGTAVTTAATGTPLLFTPRDSLVDKFVLVFVTELGCDGDAWPARVAGAATFVVYTFAATLAISFSAVFHSLCLVFIMGRKWQPLQQYLVLSRILESGVF